MFRCLSTDPQRIMDITIRTDVSFRPFRDALSARYVTMYRGGHYEIENSRSVRDVDVISDVIRHRRGWATLS